ncbi:hypothetical protein Acr_01g0008520 [Actinidia rufa]|uniref:BED-type domain-containing protein n=1 Tax=Actinidia rufa TaxID=165716 RepID=A0A7J0E3E0_9ERIC|nr:hypothetical protein Acr_01g0008520 [Actinidia rufa]
MASQGGSSSSVNIPEIREENENKPLWNYVTRLDKTARGGGNWEFQCKFCNGIFKGSYTRVKAHLMKLTGKGISACKKVTNKNTVEMQNAIDEAELKSLNSRPKKVPLPPCVSLGAMSHSQVEAKRGRSSDTSGSETMSGGAIGKAFNIKERDHLMVEIARMFYSAGLPFHLARNPYFVSAFSYTATHNIPGFVPPGRPWRDCLPPPSHHLWPIGAPTRPVEGHRAKRKPFEVKSTLIGVESSLVRSVSKQISHNHSPRRRLTVGSAFPTRSGRVSDEIGASFRRASEEEAPIRGSQGDSPPLLQDSCN